MERGAERTRSQTQEKGLAREESVAVMLLDALCLRHDKFQGRLNTFGVEEMGGLAEEIAILPESCTEVLREVQELWNRL